MTLPNKDLLRIDEVAEYFQVTDETIRLWVEHGHLEVLRPGPGRIMRITKESVDKCIFRGRVGNTNSEPESEPTPGHTFPAAEPKRKRGRPPKAEKEGKS